MSTSTLHEAVENDPKNILELGSIQLPILSSIIYENKIIGKSTADFRKYTFQKFLEYFENN